MGPGNFAINIQGGAKFSYHLLSVIVASNLMASRASAAVPRIIYFTLYLNLSLQIHKKSGVNNVISGRIVK